MQKVPALGCVWAVCFPCGRQRGDVGAAEAPPPLTTPASTRPGMFCSS